MKRNGVTYTVDVTEIGTTGLTGTSTLLRNNNGIQMRVSVDARAFDAAGSVIGGSGKESFAASLPKGRTTPAASLRSTADVTLGIRTRVRMIFHT